MSEIDLCEEYLRVGSSITVNRKLCVTSRRYLGWVSEGVVTGDIVCIFAGATVQFLLRPDGNWHYQILGDCYIQGIMYGEVLAMDGLSNKTSISDDRVRYRNGYRDKRGLSVTDKNTFI